jgi:hypothetical protein
VRWAMRRACLTNYRKHLQTRLREDVSEVANDDNGNKPTPSSAPQP